MAVDSNGAVHVVYTDDTNEDGDAYLIYKMFNPDGTVLIADTTIVETDGGRCWAVRPFIACDSSNNVHVVWHWYGWDMGTKTETVRCWYQKLNPYADDRNGSAADLGTIQSVAPKMASAGTSSEREQEPQEHYPRIAIDSDDNVHLVYTDNADSHTWYVKLSNDSDFLTEFVDIGVGDGDHCGIGIDVDSSDNVHIVTTDWDNILYSMLDNDGHILIDQTNVADADPSSNA